jgi:aryl-alcohol dehydrogenase-like predicted oxidoreductase
MMRSVEDSLKRLKTDYINLYWLHIWDSMTPIQHRASALVHTSPLISFYRGRRNVAD